ncbi:MULTISPECIES: FkbM family methyltransferase [unclassified Novosphingobium]|uniref:FkbM family methyltransferase n=1 Tax=unclassified Novosphingobium TaxID=2644732 RepID=UPI00146F0037|nr:MULTISPECIES: FkbM family methyltransferase [unclassified Novosphingobium]NMN07526.1 FkbM family methyltransferase [Novosphingobium sp. SG919]NMN89871.1 FkbM family methyltransferase [Novosphingobium sp. SG916]
MTVSTIVCRHGLFHTLTADNTLGLSMRDYGEWSESEVHLFELLLQPGDVVVEAGANIGSHTVPLSRLVGPSGSVHAFEPLGINHRLLCANLVANDCRNVRTYQVALGREAGFAKFPDVDGDQNVNFGSLGFYTAAGLPTQLCPLLPIDALALTRLNFLKIDVEGHEREIVSGALETIRRCRPVVYLETLNHYAATLDPDGHTKWAIEALRSEGYGFWHFITPLYRPDNWRGNAHNAFPGKWSFDLVCIPREMGRLEGLPNAEVDRMHCDDPDQWRHVRFIPKEPSAPPS